MSIFDIPSLVTFSIGGVIVLFWDKLSFAIGLVATLLFAVALLRKLLSLVPVSAAGKAVLITGCDTGFGCQAAQQIASKGFKVFAACLNETGKKGLEGKNPLLFPFVMDVSKDADVANGVQIVTAELKANNLTLHAVLNNAGLLRGGQVFYESLADLELQLNINLVGMARVTKAFLMLLREGKGRVINTASIVGRFAMPGLAYYSASKHAVEGYTDGLRRELAPWGIKVVIVEPGVMKTPLYDSVFGTIDKAYDTLSPELKELYGKEYFTEGKEKATKLLNKLAGNPQWVVDTYEQAVRSFFPSSRYAVGLDANFVVIPLSYYPAWLSDLIWPVLSEDPVPQALKKKAKTA